MELHPGVPRRTNDFGDACQMSGMLAEAIIQWRAALSLSGEPEQARVVEETFAASGFDAAGARIGAKAIGTLTEKNRARSACSRLSLHDGFVRDSAIPNRHFPDG